jgi:hypothetical protein
MACYNANQRQNDKTYYEDARFEVAHLALLYL